jgi:hypothetical protein
MGVVDLESSLSGRPGRAKDPQIEGRKQRALQKRQAELDAQKRVDAKRKLEQQSAKLREIDLINKTQNTRTFQAATQALRKSKVPSREIGFFKPTAPLAKRPTTTPLNAFVPDAIPNNVFLDSSGNFNPIDTNVQKYVQTRVDKDDRSRQTPIQIQHNNPPPRISRFPLSDYYAQLKGSGPLGIKGPPNGTGPVNLGFKQPFVVRGIGNNWGVDKFTGKLEGTNLQQAGQVLRIGFNFLDELGGAVIGRQPSVYVSRAGADLFRMGMFLASAKGLGFLEKQRVLKRTNPESNLGSVRGPISGVLDADLKGSESGNLLKTGTNLKKYNPLSLASQPGIPSLQIDINQKNDPLLAALTNRGRYFLPPNYTLSIEKQGGSVPEEVLKKFPSNWAKNGFNINSPDVQRKYNINIDSNLDFPSDKLLNAVAPVADAISNVAGAGVRYLKNLRGPKINISIGNPLKKLNIPKPKNPFKGIGGGNTFEINPKIANAARGFVDLVKGIKSPLDINIDKVPIDSSKKSAVTQDLDAFADVGRDRVNLIPYGPRETAKSPQGKTEEELDFIPFRFVDMNNNYIVFRAILSGISDSFTPDYAEEKYIGRPDKVYVYTGTSRTISFTFDIYPKSAEELPVLWTKMNALAGQTYPDMRSGTMVAPFTKLTIGEMYTEMPGYISALTYTVQDNGTWETLWTKSPKYLQANCTFIPIMSDLPASDQALYSYPWLQRKKNYDKDKTLLQNILKDPKNAAKFAQKDLLGSLKSQGIDTKEAEKRSKKILSMAGI